jgi:DNA gyrase/topoisomerase IV subunit B
MKIRHISRYLGACMLSKTYKYVWYDSLRCNNEIFYLKSSMSIMQPEESIHKRSKRRSLPTKEQSSIVSTLLNNISLNMSWISCQKFAQFKNHCQTLRCCTHVSTVNGTLLRNLTEVNTGEKKKKNEKGMLHQLSSHVLRKSWFKFRE